MTMILDVCVCDDNLCLSPHSSYSTTPTTTTMLCALPKTVASTTTHARWIAATVGRRSLATVATVTADLVPAQNGDRLLITENASGSPILLAKVNDKFYAVHNTCPHMKKGMEKGKIFTDEGPDPILRCRIHNSRFNMRTGECVKWLTGALGYDNALVSRVASKVGGAKQDIPAYAVQVQDDGSLVIEDGK